MWVLEGQYTVPIFFGKNIFLINEPDTKFTLNLPICNKFTVIN